MEDSIKKSICSMTRLDNALSAFKEQSTTLSSLNVHEFITYLNGSDSENNIFFPEENHEQLEKSLEIIARLPSMFLQFENNINELCTTDISAFIQKYELAGNQTSLITLYMLNNSSEYRKTDVAAIEEENNKLMELALQLR